MLVKKIIRGARDCDNQNAVKDILNALRVPEMTEARAGVDF